MDNSIYIALSRQTGLFRQLDVIANNIANANTAGFKSDNLLFQQYVVTNGHNIHNDHKLAFTHDASTVRNLQEGALNPTKNTFDFAITGDGFFSVETPLGARYTRAGNFTLDAEGTLVNAQGYPVLGPDGERIVLDRTQTDITVRENGEITIGDQQLGQIGVVSFANPRLLEKVGNSLYRSNVPPVPSTRFRVAQGMLEESNVEPVNELTTLISVNRTVSDTSNLISSLDDLERTAIQTIAKQN